MTMQVVARINVWTEHGREEDVRVVREADALAAIKAARELEQEVRDLLAGLVDIWNKKAGGRAGSPNHGHAIPGIWDSDNGALAGKPCAECALYDRARRLLGEDAGKP